RFSFCFRAPQQKPRTPKLFGRLIPLNPQPFRCATSILLSLRRLRVPRRSIFLPVFRQTGLFDLTLTSIHEKSVHTYPSRFARTSTSHLYGPAHALSRRRRERPE